MANAEVVILSGNLVRKSGDVDQPATDSPAVVTDAFYAERQIKGHERAITEASDARRLAASGLAAAIDRREGILQGRTTQILQQSTIVAADLDKMNATIVDATNNLSGAQKTETAAIAAETKCKESVLSTTARPLREISEDLFVRVEAGETGDLLDRLQKEYDRLGVVLGKTKPNSQTSAESDEAPVLTVSEQLKVLDLAVEAHNDATEKRRVKESTLNRQRQLETALVEATTPVLQNMSDHERAMNHFASLLEKQTTIVDMDETTIRRILAILWTLWLVISEPRSQGYDDTAYVQYKKAASEIETEPKVCEEIEQ